MVDYNLKVSHALIAIVFLYSTPMAGADYLSVKTDPVVGLHCTVASIIIISNEYYDLITVSSNLIPSAFFCQKFGTGGHTLINTLLLND